MSIRNFQKWTLKIDNILAAHLNFYACHMRDNRSAVSEIDWRSEMSKQPQVITKGGAGRSRTKFSMCWRSFLA